MNADQDFPRLTPESKAENIEHDTPDVVAGGLYGEVVEIMRRRSRVRT
jgi:cell shape-determining protein MreC